jgi:hypothetical protein
MSALMTRHWQELSERLAEICEQFRFRWPQPGGWGDDEVEVAAFPKESEQGQTELVIGVACGLRLRPALRGFRWTVCNALSGEEVDAGEVQRGQHFRFTRGLPAVEYRVTITPLSPVEKEQPPVKAEREPPRVILPPKQLPPLPITPLSDVLVSSLPMPLPLEWSVHFALACADRGQQVLAQFHGEIKDQDVTTPRVLLIDAQLLGTPSNVLLLEVNLNPAPERTRLVRFIIRSRDRKQLACCYVGLGDDGTGEVSLSAFDYQLETSAEDGWQVVPELVRADELQESDRQALQRSLDATPEYAHPGPIRQALERLPPP